MLVGHYYRIGFFLTNNVEDKGVCSIWSETFIRDCIVCVVSTVNRLEY